MKKGFTLIELMVVIAIIGILAVALVPQLTGAQARSRDAARIAGIGNISAALAAYYSDVGQYPIDPVSNATEGDGCFSSSSGAVIAELSDMLKGGIAPLDPQAKNTVADCSAESAYGYTALQRSGVNAAGYILSANVETWRKANANYGSLTLPDTKDGADGTNTYEAISTDANASTVDASTTDPNSIYIDIN